MSLGVLAELVTSYSIQAKDTYSVAETVEDRPTQAPRRNLDPCDERRNDDADAGSEDDTPVRPRQPGRERPAVCRA